MEKVVHTVTSQEDRFSTAIKGCRTAFRAVTCKYNSCAHTCLCNVLTSKHHRAAGHNTETSNPAPPAPHKHRFRDELQF